MEEIKQAIRAAVKDLFNVEIEPILTRPDEQFGDYSTNVAMQLAGQLRQNPRELAEQIAEQISLNSKNHESPIKDVAVDGPGFINLHLTDEFLTKQAFEQPIDKSLEGKVVVAEYSDPNPFKVLHAGHLYTSVVGDAIANLLAQAGATVHRVNFGGDVGLHVGKTMWAIIKKLGGENPDKLNEVPLDKHAEWLAEAYVDGTNAYEDDEAAKKAIVDLNKKIYQIQADKDHESALAQIYWTTRQWSYDYFNQFYDRIGTKFEKYYPESEVSELGLKIVREQQAQGVFKESDGAIIFDGDSHDLHTRVFINREGIPTYEAKDVGLIFTKKQDYNFDISVVITGNEQEQYMSVVLKAIEQFAPDLAKATRHIPHGIVKLQGGVKMSSRKGNILRAVDVLEAAAEANQAATGKADEAVELGAVKYAFLKQRIGADIIYDPTESVSIQGNSGPYLQYAHARARSILNKAQKPVIPTAVEGSRPANEISRQARDDKDESLASNLQAGERSLVRKLGEYPEVVNKAVEDLLPHHIANYLYELAQAFNRFYETNRVIGDPRQAERLKLVEKYANTLRDGLNLLNIHAPDKM